MSIEVLSIPEVQKAFLEAMQGVVDSATLADIVKAIEANDEQALINAVNFNPAVLNKVLDAIENAYEQAAVSTVSNWPINFIFNVRNARVEEDLRNFSSQFIVRITEEVRENIRRSLEQGLIRGDNPRATALNIVGRFNPVTKKREGGVLGIDVRQRQWAESARQYLETRNPRYLSMGLRDKRFDAIVEKAIESGKPIPAETIDKLVTSYKNKALKYRAESIARTETIQAINRGEQAAHVQGIEEGVLRSNAVTKEWDDSGDGRVRTTHNVLGEKYGRGKGIDFEDAFISPSGARLMVPGDSSLGAPVDEIAQCRCRVVYKVDWVKNRGG